MGALRKPHHALAAQPARRISLRTKGRANGQLTRLVSPSDIGQAIKPFLLDRFVVEAHKPLNVPMHPHSGIAVLTTLLDGSLQIIDTRGMPATLLPGATDWIRTGRGTWHGGPGIATGEVRGYQLWISLPPALELSEPYEQIFAPDRIPVEGPARVLLGAYNGTQSPLAPPAPMTCLHVELDAGERWCYDPPPEHDVLWIAVYTGSLDAGEPVEAGELIVRLYAGLRAAQSVRRGGGLFFGAHESGGTALRRSGDCAARVSTARRGAARRRTVSQRGPQDPLRRVSSAAACAAPARRAPSATDVQPMYSRPATATPPVAVAPSRVAHYPPRLTPHARAPLHDGQTRHLRFRRNAREYVSAVRVRAARACGQARLPSPR